jgi:hypothetical protein
MAARGRVITASAAVLISVAVTTWSTAPSVAAPDTARIFVVQGLPGRVVAVAVDGRTVASGLAGATLSPPVDIQPGTHTVTFTSGGSEVLRRSVSLKAGSNSDLVLHLPVNPTGAAVLTVYDNATPAVPRDKASLTVAHTAAVPPADVRVNGKVLFANIANGEQLNLVVPVATYTVDIVPAGATSPVVLGPLKLTVKGGSLNRVFAVGDPQSSTMRAVVHVLPAGSTGSPAPDLVDTGSGGQAADRTSALLAPLLPAR